MDLRTYLKRHGIGPVEFAAKIGVSRPAVDRYVKGARWPGRETMEKIVQATDGAVTANDFLSPPVETSSSGEAD